MTEGDSEDGGDEEVFFSYRWEYSTPRRPLTVAQEVHYVLSWAIIRIAVPILILLTLSIPVYVLIELNIEATVAFIALPLALYILNVLVVSTWRATRWLRKVVETYWRGQTPPHRDELAGEITSISDMYRHAFSQYDKVLWPIESENQEETVLFAAMNGGIGYITFVLMGVLITVIGDYGMAEGLQDSTISGSGVSFHAAIISVLLGGAFGLFTLGGAILASSLFDFVGYVLLLGVPSIFFAPSAMNILVRGERWFANLSATEDPAETTIQTLRIFLLLSGTLITVLVIYGIIFQVI